MLKLIVGFVIGAGLSSLLGMPGVVAGGLLIGGIALQVAFTHRLNRFLGDVDPVAIGVRSLDKLKAIAPVPLSVSVLDFAAKTALWGMVAALLSVIGWVRIG